MRDYEAIFLINNPDDEEYVKKIIKKINTIVKNNNCNIYKKEKLGKRKLAYEIKNNNYAYYYFINFTNEDDKKLDNKLRTKFNTLEEVMKYLIFLKK